MIDSIVVTDVTCAGFNDGSITVYASGGFPDYTFQIFNPPALPQSITTSSNSFVFTGLGSGAGDYFVQVIGEDGGGGNCPQPPSAFVSVNDPPPFNFVLSTTNDTCPDGNVGTATVSVTGGVEPYSFLWTPGMLMGDSVFWS